VVHRTLIECGAELAWYPFEESEKQSLTDLLLSISRFPKTFAAYNGNGVGMFGR